MLRVKKDVAAFTVNTGVINIQVDKNTSQENLAIVAGIAEFEGLIEGEMQNIASAQASPEKENKVVTQKNKDNEK
jgi:hypothetical protein